MEIFAFLITTIFGALVGAGVSSALSASVVLGALIGILVIWAVWAIAWGGTADALGNAADDWDDI